MRWDVQYTTLEGAPAARDGRFEFSLRETRDELVRAGMPHLGHFLFNSSHVFRYARVSAPERGNEPPACLDAVCTLETTP